MWDIDDHDANDSKEEVMMEDGGILPEALQDLDAEPNELVEGDEGLFEEEVGKVGGILERFYPDTQTRFVGLMSRSPDNSANSVIDL